MTEDHAGAGMRAHQAGNRLARESSPYLQQHARNPVDWYPWGEEALAAARAQDRPIFVSVGYSSCHWCHVMERESFEDEEVARFMNGRRQELMDGATPSSNAVAAISFARHARLLGTAWVCKELACSPPSLDPVEVRGLLS